MYRFSATLMTVTTLLFIAGTAFAATSVEAAIKQLDTDVTKLKADSANHAGRDTLLADKEKVKFDKSALAAARRNAKMYRDLPQDQ